MSHQSELIAADIKRYLQEHEQKKLLRLLTCGSVDDGKSTLIGRLLHDAKMIYEDQLAHLTRDSEKHGTTGAEMDLALLVDGLQAEREQGITIDVAYRYFSTAKRKFIIADTPGHEQYTRNMATGASTCDLAIILIDARQGVQVQTRRHSFIVSLLGIKHVLVAVNKMDLVDYSQARFEQIQADYLAFAQTLNFRSIQCVPISALLGDNVVSLSEHMPWYSGQPLMSQLEQVEVAADATDKGFRFPVQYVNRPHLNFRGYCGTITSGRVSKGDTITVLPSGKSSRIESLLTWEGEIEHAFAPMAITLTLDDEIDISRGDLLVHSKATPSESVPITRDISAHLVWMDETPLNTTRAYEFKLASQRQTAQVLRVQHKINVNSMAQEPATTLRLNDIARVDLRLERAIPVDDYQLHKATGAFILVDKMSHRTVAAGMALATTVQTKSPLQLTSESIIHADVWEKRWGQKGQIVCITGGSERAQRTGLYTLEKALFDRGYTAIVLEAQLANEKICHSLCSKGIIVLTNAAMNIQGVQSVVVKDDAANLYSLVEESLVRLIAESNRLIS